MGIGTPTLTEITIDPPGPVTLYRGGYVTFTATEHYDDGSTSALGPTISGTVPYATWTTFDTDVATVNNGSAFWGRVYGVGDGSTTIKIQEGSHPYDPTYGATVDVTVVDAPADVGIVEPARVSLGFGTATLDPFPTWTPIDSHPNLVTSYTIDRGRQYELDQTDAGRASVAIVDPDGILDPTNPSGPYYGQIRPMLQAKLCRHNPVTDTWEDRFRGFVEDYSYEVDSTVSKLTMTLVDLFDILGNAQMQPHQFGDSADKGQIVYSGDRLPRDRMMQILGEVGLPTHMTAIFSGNVHLQKSTYSAGESPLTAIQDAANGEFPGVGNVYCDRHGRLSFHGRYARFDPVGAAAANLEWDYHDWKAGDGFVVEEDPTHAAHVRALSFQRGVSKIINNALATEQGAPDDTTSRQVTDAASVALYGMRSWSTSNLLTASGDLAEAHPTSAATETKRFAQFYVSNYAQPRDRISQLTFKSLHPSDPRAAANWALLSGIDIADTIEVTVSAPGGGGFTSEGYFVEGVHEQVDRLAPGYDEVVLTLDLSPRAYYGVNPWDTPLASPDTSPAPTNPHKKPHPTGKPKIHGPDHLHGGPDPIPIAYDNVGIPIADLPGGGGGGGGGGDVDLTPYLHWGTNPGAPETAAGSGSQVEIDGHVDINALTVASGALDSDLHPIGPLLDTGAHGMTIVNLTAGGAGFSASVTGDAALAGAHVDIGGHVVIHCEAGLQIYGLPTYTPGDPPTGDSNVIGVDASGYLRILP